jgi:hypothetical protein
LINIPGGSRDIAQRDQSAENHGFDDAIVENAHEVPITIWTRRGTERSIASPLLYADNSEKTGGKLAYLNEPHRELFIEKRRKTIGFPRFSGNPRANRTRDPSLRSQHRCVFFSILQYCAMPPKPLKYQGFGGFFVLCRISSY